MFKYLILLLVSLTCLASDPKFHYMDCVEVTTGFYKGCKGNVISYDSDIPHSYSVDVEDCKGQDFYKDFDESQLKRCTK